MRRKRSRSKAIGTSVKHVKRTASTQLDVDKLERELLSRDRKAESAIKKRATLRRTGAKSSDSFSRQRNRLGSLPQAGTSKRRLNSIDRTTSKQPVGNFGLGTSAQVHDSNQTEGNGSVVTPCNTVQGKLEDINENAPQSSHGSCHSCSRRKSQGRRRGAGRRRKYASYSIIKLPVNSVLRVDSDSNSSSIHRRSYKRRTPLTIRKSVSPQLQKVRRRRRSVNSSSGKPYPNVSFSKGQADSKSGCSSRYQVTPCPTDRRCSSHRSYSSDRISSPRSDLSRRKHQYHRCSRRSYSCPRSLNRSCSNSISRKHRTPRKYRQTSSKTSGTCSRGVSCSNQRSRAQAPLYPQHRSRSRPRHKNKRSPSRERSLQGGSSSGSSSTCSSAVRKASRILKRISSTLSNERKRARHRRRRSRAGSRHSRERNLRAFREFSRTLKHSSRRRRSHSPRSRPDYRREEIKKKENSLMCAMM